MGKWHISEAIIFGRRLSRQERIVVADRRMGRFDRSGTVNTEAHDTAQRGRNARVDRYPFACILLASIRTIPIEGVVTGEADFSKACPESPDQTHFTVGAWLIDGGWKLIRQQFNKFGRVGNSRRFNGFPLKAIPAMRSIRIPGLADERDSHVCEFEPIAVPSFPGDLLTSVLDRQPKMTRWTVPRYSGTHSIPSRVPERENPSPEIFHRRIRRSLGHVNVRFILPAREHVKNIQLVRITDEVRCPSKKAEGRW